MARTLTFVLGGTRSGKSAFAQQLAAERAGDHVLFLATLRETQESLNDPEMQQRIARHRTSRPMAWHTHVIEDDLGAIADVIAQSGAACVLLDCLSLYISGRLFMQSELPANPEDAALAATDALLDVYRASAVPWIIVSNEVGMGIVPDNPWARAYRDALGRANQRVAHEANEMHFVVAGLPMRLK